MNGYEFMSDSPWLTFFLALLVIGYLFKFWNRLMRHLSVRCRGWPPAHLDADGEFRPAPKAN